VKVDVRGTSSELVSMVGAAAAAVVRDVAWRARPGLAVGRARRREDDNQLIAGSLAMPCP